MGKRNDNRRPRRAVSAVVTTAALVAAVTVIAPRLVPGDKLAARVAEAVAAATGAEVTVGSAHLTLLGGPGLQVTDARVVRQGQYDVALDRADISLAVLPLARRQLVVDGARARGRTAHVSWRGQSLALSTFDVKASGLNYALPKLDAAARGAGVAAGPLLPADLKGSLSVTLAHGAWSSFAVDDLALQASLKQGIVTVRSLACRTAGGDVSATGSWNPGPAGAAAAVDGVIRLAGVDAAALLRPWAPEVATQLDARVSGDARLACTLGDAATIRATLAGDGRLHAARGTLRTGPWLAEAKPYLGSRQDLVDIRFDQLRHVFRVGNGSYQLDTLAIRGPDTNWDLQGALGFDGSADLAVHLCLPPDFVPNLGSMTMYAMALRDAERRVNLDITVRGPLADPMVGLDFVAMSKRLAKPRGAAG